MFIIYRYLWVYFFTVITSVYLTNEELHRELEMETLDSITKKYARSHEERLGRHVNIQAIQLLANNRIKKTQED